MDITGSLYKCNLRMCSLGWEEETGGGEGGGPCNIQRRCKWESQWKLLIKLVCEQENMEVLLMFALQFLSKLLRLLFKSRLQLIILENHPYNLSLTNLFSLENIFLVFSILLLWKINDFCRSNKPMSFPSL